MTATTAPVLKSDQALAKLLSDYQFQTVLDVGCGYGRHAERFRAAGKQVTCIDIVALCEGVLVANYLEHEFREPFDCIWMSHILEHQLNVNFFLRKAHRELREGGLLAITVPPLKHEIVGGHVTLWNAGLVLYNLIVAGFDCSQAIVKCYGYNISVITPKITATIPFHQLHFDRGDIEILSPFFPKVPGVDWKQGFNGQIQQLNWDGPGLEVQARETIFHRLLGKYFTRDYWWPRRPRHGA